MIVTVGIGTASFTAPSGCALPGRACRISFVPLTAASSLVGRVPAPLLFLLGGLSLYVGAAIAVLLFDELQPATVAWLRLLAASVVLVAWRRPRVTRSAWRGRRLLLAGLFGLTTALMNVAFYEAIARLPLGTAVAIEFCGPVAVAAVGSRTPRDVGALVLAAIGVLLIADVQWAGSPTGVVLALAAASLWAAYIVLGKRLAGGGTGLDDMAVGFVIASALCSPLALGSGPVWGSPRLLALAVGVGVLSSVVPYVLDQVVLRRVGRARFALLLALLPVTAPVIGLVALGQVPRPVEAFGIVAVIAAVLLRTPEPEQPPVQRPP
jgi:inner membrane transporter RhtA